MLRAALGGFSYHKARDDDVAPVMDRVGFLRDIGRFMDVFWCNRKMLIFK